MATIREIARLTNDAIRAVKLIAGAMADAVLEGRQGEQMDEAEAEEEVAAAE